METVTHLQRANNLLSIDNNKLSNLYCVLVNLHL